MIVLGDGKALVVGGQNTGVTVSGAELYDPATGVWTVVGELLEARSSHSATLVRNGEVLVAGGYSGGELYSAELGSWSAG